MEIDSFIEEITSFSKRVKNIIDSVRTEEATKTSIIMPFFQILGYDVFNPSEFVPEFTADVGVKKHEKVDFAIMQDGNPVILIEAKAVNEDLTKHGSQLFRYFGTTSAKFAILTNGILYQFFTDLEEQNKMDKLPFFEFNLLEPRENLINELAKFRKKLFNVDDIFNAAEELKYTKQIRDRLNKEWENPTDEFVTYIISEIYPGKKTKNVIERFRPLVKQSLKQFINDLLNDKLKAALSKTDEEPKEKRTDIEPEKVNDDKPEIITTEEEIEGYAIVKMLIKDVIDPERVFYRDNLSYFNVLIDDNIRKWICRLWLNSENNKYIQFNDDERTTERIEKVADIEKFTDKLISIAEKFK